VIRGEKKNGMEKMAGPRGVVHCCTNGPLESKQKGKCPCKVWPTGFKATEKNRRPIRLGQRSGKPRGKKQNLNPARDLKKKGQKGGE